MSRAAPSGNSGRWGRAGTTGARLPPAPQTLGVDTCGWKALVETTAMTGLLTRRPRGSRRHQMVSPETPDTGGPGKANSPVRSPPEADWTFHE